MVKIIIFFISFVFSLYASGQIPERFRSMKKHPNSLYIPENEKTELRSNRSAFYTNDFSNPADWTMTNTSSPSYDWEIDTILPSNLNVWFDSQINSTSGGNFAFIDSYNQISNTNQNCNMTNLIPIDCSSQSGVLLSFENYFYKENETHSVMISNDGVNFQNFEVNHKDYYFSSNAEVEIINISCVAANQPNIWIRFNFTGSENLFWSIDDVALLDASTYDLHTHNILIHNATINPILGVPLDYYVVPQDLLEDILVKSSVSNFGADTAFNSYFKGSFTNSSSVVVVVDSTSVFDSAPCDSVFQDSLIMTPPNIIGNYSIGMEAKFDSLIHDGNLSDNKMELSFVIGTNTNQLSPNLQWARDNNIHSTLGLWNGSGNGYIWGNVFCPINDVSIYSIDVAFAPNTDPGVVGCVILYEIDASTGDFIPLVDLCLDGYEYLIYPNEISTSTFTRWKKFCITPYQAWNPFLLESGKSYIAAINHYGGSEEMVLQYGGEAASDFTSFLFDQSDATWYYTTSKPKIRLGFEWPFWCIGSVEDLSNPFQLQTYPNPSHDYTTISYTLNEALEINLEITDVTGNCILRKNLGNQSIGEHHSELDVSSLCSGIYFYSISSDGLKSTQKLVVTHE